MLYKNCKNRRSFIFMVVAKTHHKILLTLSMYRWTTASADVSSASNEPSLSSPGDADATCESLEVLLASCISLFDICLLLSPSSLSSEELLSSGLELELSSGMASADSSGLGSADTVVAYIYVVHAHVSNAHTHFFRLVCLLCTGAAAGDECVGGLE